MVVLLDPDRAKRRALLSDLGKAGFELAKDAVADLERLHSTPLGLVLPNGGRIVVELLVPEPEREKLTRRIVARARTMPFPGLAGGVRVVSPEDLVLYKIRLLGRRVRPDVCILHIRRDCTSLDPSARSDRRWPASDLRRALDLVRSGW